VPCCAGRHIVLSVAPRTFQHFSPGEAQPRPPLLPPQNKSHFLESALTATPRHRSISILPSGTDAALLPPPSALLRLHVPPFLRRFYRNSTTIPPSPPMIYRRTPTRRCSSPPGPTSTT
ncbi:unnamed protein product, partial [Ectocarpus sp. 12 AP-2014]